MSLCHGLNTVVRTMVLIGVVTAIVSCDSKRVAEPLESVEPIPPKEVAAALECAKDGARVLRVGIGSDGEVQISESTRQRPTVSDISSLGLPFDPSIGLPLEPATVELRQGSWTALSTDDGWFVGANSGEFTGGLWWFDRISKLPELLRRENTIFVGAIGRHNFAIMDRGPSESGAAVRIDRVGKSWTLVDVGSFAGVPIRVFSAAPAAMLVASTTGLFRFDGSTIGLLSSEAKGLSLATEMTGAETGGLTYVGMPMLLLVVPRSAVQPAWYRRKGCALRLENRSVEVGGALALVKECVC